jgi:hypothetical protein
VHRTEIGLADYLLAVGRLRAQDPRLRQRIAKLLGLADSHPFLQDALEEPAEPAPASPAPTLAVEEPPAGQMEPELQDTAVVEAPVWVEPLDAERADLRWPDGLPAGPDFSDTTGTRPEVPSLLAPRLERGIVQLVLASERPGGQLDLDATLTACARLELSPPLPTRSEWSVHGGSDLLVDVSSELAPFADDIDRLLLLADHIGGEATRILYFEHCPGRGVFSEDQPYGSYRPENRRTVVVGAFGSSPARTSAGPEEWRSVIGELRTRVEVVGLCPFEAGRAAFAQLLPMVPWSEATTTNVVTRVLGAREWSSSTS